MNILRQTLAVLAKEMTIELRTREIIYTTLLFGGIIVVVFAFGFTEGADPRQAAPGVLWTAMLFAGTVTINRTFDREREGNCISALTLVPGIGPPLFLGKFLANVIFLLALEVMVAPLVLVMFKFTSVPHPLGLALTLGLGVVAYASLGTLVGAMLAHVRLRGILLPLVLFPLMIPVFGVGVTATGTFLSGDALGWSYIPAMLAFDFLLLIVSAWLFSKLIETL